jgi:hypothetical protein
MSVVNFPTTIKNYSGTAIDNVFIEISRKDDISVELVTYELSDHDAQLLVIKNVELSPFIIITENK